MARYNGGFGGGNQMQQLMKQAQKMQEDLQRKQKELEDKTFSSTSGGGMVTVEMNGKRQITKLSIRPEIVSADDVEMLEDLIIAAFNETSKKIDDEKQTTMGNLPL